MFGDVNVKVEDGNLGRSSSTGTGTSIKIGISNVESKSPILISGTMNAKKIKEKVGNTPLADACIDAVEWGASSIYCIPVKAGTAGTIGKITEDQKGYGTFEVKGSPNNASANMMSPEGSDYSYAEDVRVSNRLVKAVRAKALDELQVEVDPGDIETSITNIQEQLNTPVEDAVRDKVISSGSVTIDTENLNILVDEKLDINITYVPMGHVMEMNLTFAVENPYAAS